MDFLEGKLKDIFTESSGKSYYLDTFRGLSVWLRSFEFKVKTMELKSYKVSYEIFRFQLLVWIKTYEIYAKCVVQGVHVIGTFW